MIMELEYNEDLDEYFIVIPESMLAKLDWEEGDMLEYELEDEVLRIFKI
jgi:bifunctional DNA-binding transcriptional regulator/antitoxin component of YhaV-PrlF toxin-antitoxin module